MAITRQSQRIKYDSTVSSTKTQIINKRKSVKSAKCGLAGKEVH